MISYILTQFILQEAFLGILVRLNLLQFMNKHPPFLSSSFVENFCFITSKCFMLSCRKSKEQCAVPALWWLKETLQTSSKDVCCESC